MTFTAKAFIVCDLGRRRTDISRLPVTPFNTVINPDVTNCWSGAGEFHRPESPLYRAFMDFYPTLPLSLLDCHNCVVCVCVGGWVGTVRW